MSSRDREDYRSSRSDHRGGYEQRDSHNDRHARYRDDRGSRDYDRPRRSPSPRRERSGNDRYYERPRDSRDDRSSRYSRDDRSRYDDNRRGRSMSDGDPVQFDRSRQLSPFRGEVVPLDKRPRHLKNWDAAPSGFERIRADIAKQTGLFPPPGNVAKMTSFAPPVLDPARAAMLAMLSGDMSFQGGQSVFVGGSTFGTAYSKHTKRVYVGHLPIGVTDWEVEDFFNSMLRSDKPLAPGEVEQPAVTGVMLSTDKAYAFVDFRTPELANMAIDMNGMQFKGNQIKVKRPRDQSDTTNPDDPDNLDPSSDMYVLSNLPTCLQEAHVRHLLKFFGDLRSFIFLRRRGTKTPMGIVVYQFEENILNELAFDGLAKVSMGQHKFKVQGLMDCRSDAHLWSTLCAFNLTPLSESVSESTVIQLMNIANEEDLIDDHRYMELLAEVKQEAERFGEIVGIHIPRPRNDEPVPGLGRVFIEYAIVEEASTALEALCGRRFGEEVVVGGMYPKDRLDQITSENN